jgi:hypothetical protein
MITEGWAVLEDEHAKTFNVLRSWLPGETQEGDQLDVSQQLACDGPDRQRDPAVA